MTSQDRSKRRSLIIRRQKAYRVSRAQRELWRKRRSTQDEDLDETVSVDDLLAGLPEALLS